MVLSFSFLELGQFALCQNTAWQTPVVVRTSIIGTIDGGWSTMLAVYLKRQLLGPSGLVNAGVPLMLHGDEGQPTLMFAKLEALLSDGQGLAMAFNWKGHGSLKPCFKHYNVFKKEQNVSSNQTSP
jgi:hypothetical protein